MAKEVTLVEVAATLSDGLSPKTRECAVMCAFRLAGIIGGDTAVIVLNHNCASPSECKMFAEIRGILMDGLRMKATFVRPDDADQESARCWRWPINTECVKLRDKQRGAGVSSIK